MTRLILAIVTALTFLNSVGWENSSAPTIDAATKSEIITNLLRTPLHFIENRGQLDGAVAYYAQADGATIFYTNNGITFGFGTGSLSVRFYDDDRTVQPYAREKMDGTVNYFIGNDESRWRSDLQTFSEVVYPAVYPGIDLVYSGNQRRLKYTYHVAPNANPTLIQLHYDGVERISIDANIGELVLLIDEDNTIRDDAPIAHQIIDGERANVEIAFRMLDDNSVGFELGNYDVECPLILDPGYSTFLDGSDVAYVASIDGTITLIDMVAQTVLDATISVDNFTQDIAYNPILHKFYVTCTSGVVVLEF